MTKSLEYLFLFLVFPGFLFSAVMGLMAGWVERKITAKLQWRVGPPWYQNFIDVLKLMLYKETLIPSGVSGLLFLGLPLIALAGATLVSTMILTINTAGASGFAGDIIVIIYLMLIPSIALMIGGFVSANTLASLGSSREMKLMLSYELPFILALLVPVIKSGYGIKLSAIIASQASDGYFIGSISGIISFIVMILCIQAKLGFVPFDMPEAETELMAGPYIEYSGKALGVFKLTKAVMLFAIPVFLIMLYFGGVQLTLSGIVKNVFQYILILALMVVIKNTNPRVRIDHAMKFFWGPVTAMAVIAVIFSYFGY